MSIHYNLPINYGTQEFFVYRKLSKNDKAVGEAHDKVNVSSLI